MSRGIEVHVRRNGQVIASIQRPLRELDGEPAVTYKNRLWPLIDGNTIELGDAEPSAPRLPRALTSTPQPTGTQVAASPPPAIALELTLPRETEDLRADAPTWQDDPIQEPPHERLIIDAGPGTGKTHAACRRVAEMINGGIPATRIWLVSFTRTAVAEIRNRIASALTDPSTAASVRIITLDAFAWAVQSGYSHDAKLTGSFDDNIEKALDLIRDDLDVRDDLARIEHLIVDEAQDIVGQRADLVLAIIDALEPESGVSVFSDRAQAIYEFSKSRQESEATNLLDELDRRGFRQMQLVKVHRTKDPNLLEIFTTLRSDLLAGREDLENYVRGQVQELAHEDVGQIRNLKISEIPEDALVLTRTRLDALMASSYAGLHPHRLRLSGLPICIRPWIAHLFWDFVQRRISRADFEKLWQDRNPNAPYGCDEAWQRCFEIAADSASVLDLHRLRKALARSNPPMLFCSPEFGASGPILGTIHASKGREASTVYLYLQSHEVASGTDEEARVIFVGATRPRERLLVGSTTARYGRTTYGRVWNRAGLNVQIEVGRPDDLEPTGLVGRPYFSNQEAALAAQHAWASQPLRQGMQFRKEEALNWKFSLYDREQRLAGMTARFQHDVDRIAHDLDKRIFWLGHGRSIGLRTLVVAPDSSQLENLLEPWKSSGFMFAPLLTSLSLAKLRPR